MMRDMTGRCETCGETLEDCARMREASKVRHAEQRAQAARLRAIEDAARICVAYADACSRCNVDPCKCEERGYYHADCAADADGDACRFCGEWLWSPACERALVALREARASTQAYEYRAMCALRATHVLCMDAPV